MSFSNERKWNSTCIEDDLLQVGIHKAIGYLPEKGKLSFELLKKLELQCRNNGKLTAYNLPTMESNSSCNTLWVGDEIMIQNILNNNKRLLLSNNLPIIAYDFFHFISNNFINHDQEQLYHMVAELFNSRCLFCDVQYLKVINSYEQSSRVFKIIK